VCTAAEEPLDPVAEAGCLLADPTDRHEHAGEGEQHDTEGSATSAAEAHPAPRAAAPRPAELLDAGEPRGGAATLI